MKMKKLTGVKERIGKIQYILIYYICILISIYIKFLLFLSFLFLIYRSPVEWIRMDPDTEWLTLIILEQTHFMWGNQLQKDKDVIAQHHVIICYII